MINDGVLRTVTEDEARGLVANSVLEDDCANSGDCEEEESSVGKHRKRRDSLFRVEASP